MKQPISYQRYEDACKLLIQDLLTPHEETRHKAAFKNCTAELDGLIEVFIIQLENEIFAND